MPSKVYAISNPSAAIALRYGKNVSKGIQNFREAFIDAIDSIDEALTTCAFYDEMCSGEGGCLGNRNGERECDGCSYFEIDGNQLKAVVASIRDELASGPSVRGRK